jgi:hypothetical protein
MVVLLQVQKPEFLSFHLELAYAHTRSCGCIPDADADRGTGTSRCVDAVRERAGASVSAEVCAEKAVSNSYK